MEFEELRDKYQTVNQGCCKTGKIYSFRNNKINPVFCLNWSCDRCRRKLKNYLYMSTLVNVLSFDLDRHFIITSRGKNFRTMYTYEESYDYMSYGWKKLKQRIQRKYGYFDYICFPRAQRDGYVHLHVIVNKFIPWSFLKV